MSNLAAQHLYKSSLGETELSNTLKFKSDMVFELLEKVETDEHLITKIKSNSASFEYLNQPYVFLVLVLEIFFLFY